MKKRLCSLLLVLTMLSTLLVAPASALEADGSTSVQRDLRVSRREGLRHRGS